MVIILIVAVGPKRIKTPAPLSDVSVYIMRLMCDSFALILHEIS